ncbi:MAG: LamG-like jellyroll fold domain-containing protein, partial [Elusimicrobiota bacterium]
MAKWRTLIFGIGIIFLFFCINFVSAFGWWNSDWSNCQELNVTGGDTTLTDFPFLINISYLAGMQTDFDDIRIIDEPCWKGYDGKELPYEIDYKTDEYALLWVKGDLSTGINQFSVYYNNSAAPNGENRSLVWNNDYIGVWHLNENALPYIDSSSHYNFTMGTIPNNETGKFGYAQNFSAANSEVLFAGFNSGNFYDLSEGFFTIEYWMKPNGDPGTQRMLSCHKSDTSGGWVNYVKGAFDANDDGTGAGWNTIEPAQDNPADTWIHNTIRRNTSFIVIQNGTEQGTPLTAFNIILDEENAALVLGARTNGTDNFANAKIDELRISNTSRSDSWIKRSYDNSNFSFSALSACSDENITFYEIFYNSSTYETARENFLINISYNSSLKSISAAYLYYNGTQYEGTKEGTGHDVSFSTSLNIPLISVPLNYSFYWQIQFSDSSNFTSPTYNQSVGVINLNLCNSTYTVPY